ncbi:helix-turn-helix domain-containing protein [Halobacillus shinanisalinarum]|uniref:Helix-turn-helix domain-containing protein n=1 Tax=Halobacillus shinanisalinarum TaxID=2932258 RepID=A0ABY4H002_9BACI|nr:helix-turn-helix domain-containing protein [Halobacillus shinanisalinarum]UOQ93616.1 helix-turn-helix domain-containing protein [Halobacillus shinanisalinarum]
MDREVLIEQVSKRIKLIRVEFGYTQNRMAAILGVSKKTLVQIEKERTQANWTTVVAVCALFKESDIMRSMLGDAPLEIIETVAHEQIDLPKRKTIGGKMWWTTAEEKGQYKLQQNVISQHFRIIDEHGYRWYSSFNKEEALFRYSQLTTKD